MKTLRSRTELVTGALICAVLMFAGWNWIVRASVLSFGPPDAVYLSTAKAGPGDTIQVHFRDVTWYRLCKSETIMSFQPKNGLRFDFPVHQTSTPMTTGKIPPKSRALTLPVALDASQYGAGIVSGHVRSSCWPVEGLPIVTPLPDMALEIVRRG
jgi:hypothetical protein